MIPKDKALELCQRFGYLGIKWEQTEYTTLSLENAKQCASIVVNEMLNNAGFIWGGTDSETGLSARDAFRKYWNEVKEEIEKL